jgi:nicotinate-nucleotide pyrophosphorylase (carboxylating)
VTLRAEVAAALTAAGLDPVGIESLARAALAEDLALGPDVTTTATIGADSMSRGAFVARQPGLVAGAVVAAAVLDCSLDGRGEITFAVADGASVRGGQPVLVVEGPTRELLTAERSALNFLCHLSGIATATRRWVDAIQGTGAAIRDTRKTLPGLRTLQKYAVRCGGGVNHRMGLGDAALIKDNHIAAAGSLTAAFVAVRTAFPSLLVQVECDTEEQVQEAIAAGAKHLLLDNMSVAEIHHAVGLARPSGVETLEASGGLTLAVAREVAETGVDFLAVGELTHSARSLDIGFDLDV